MIELTKEVVEQAHKAGFRVFVADEGRGDYGVIKNSEGLVMSFWPGPFGGMSFASCWKSKEPCKNAGQGGLIAEGLCRFDIKELFKQYTMYESCTPKTLQEHFKLYQDSSKYKEV